MCFYSTARMPKHPLFRVQTLGLAGFGAVLAFIGLILFVPGVRVRVQDIFWFSVKVAGFMYLYIWYRGTFPRYRFDQLMKVGWKVLLPHRPRTFDPDRAGRDAGGTVGRSDRRHALNPPVATTFFFYMLAAVMIIGGVLVITRKNAVHSALALITTLLAQAAIYLMLYAPFVAGVQIILYAGGIMVLFLFVIMLISPGAKPERAAVQQAMADWHCGRGGAWRIVHHDLHGDFAWTDALH